MTTKVNSRWYETELSTLYVADFAEGLLYFSKCFTIYKSSPCFLLETGITPNYKEQYYITLDPTIRGTCPVPVPAPLSSCLLSYDEKRTGSCDNMQEVSGSSDLVVLPTRGGDQNSGSGKNV